MWWAGRIMDLRHEGKADTDEYREAVRQRDKAREELKAYYDGMEAEQ
jgi:hypothetical protein